MPYEKRFAEISARKLEIRAMLEGSEQVDMDKIEEELRGLETEEKQLRSRLEVMERLKGGQPPAETKIIETAGAPPMTREDKEKELAEKRGQDLKENRTVTVGSSNILLPKHQASDIRPTFNEVSSLIDRVSTKPLIGGESYQQPYIDGYGIGDYTLEGADYASAEATFAYVDINKAKITAYAEDTEEVQKLPAAAYDAEVMKGITVATRKKISREILVGTGATNRLAGIFSAAATAIDAATDLALTEIDETTLDEIIYTFGGDENVEDAAVLILNKVDLKAFATLRDADGKKIYDVKSNGNTGTIDGIPFIINSACYAVSAAATTAGQYCMAYGPLSNYLMTIFSDMDVQRSTDYLFKKGMIAHRGSIFIGGNVISKNGFLRVKKG
ncbi:phage major capsid protein [Pelotomaculum propionicicum]|uniref:phage major capsid protein n=1 Tax=Pelotomaculum propionicicum TaxID=258475 RepID=UPI003B80DE9E